MTGEAPADWRAVQDLADQLERGAVINAETVAELLLRVAPAVGLPAEDATAELRTSAGTENLIREIARRIGEGSVRLGDALLESYARVERGDVEGARHVLEQILEVEVVPLYRRLVEGELEDLSGH